MTIKALDEAGRRAQAASILVVEDELIVARDLQATLADLGYDAFAIAASADDAILSASRRCPNIVLMDIRIKGGRDGIEAADILRKRFDVPVVFLTAHSDEATLARARQTEPFGYLIKPVNPAELRSVIEVALHRHTVEKRLRESARWHSTALRSIADAVLAVDVIGTVTFLNPAAESLLGRPAASMVGRPVSTLMRLAAPETDAVTASFEEILRSGQVLQAGENDPSGGSGPRCVLVDSVGPILDGGRIVGAVAVLRSAGAQQQQGRRQELSERLISLGTMAATTAHELNNALCVVTTDASFIAGELRKIRGDLRDSALAQRTASRLDEIAEALDEIESAASRMDRIVSDLRNRSRPAESPMHVANLPRCVDWALRATAHEFTDRASVQLRLSETPPARGDESRIGQVLVNLLKNAAHSFEPGDPGHNVVTISTRMNIDGSLVVEVSDTGCGIPPQVLDRIFEPFFTTKPVGVGTGLGLSVCQGIVNSIGGRIEVESQVGTGTTFRLSLAAAAPSPGAPPQTVAPTDAVPRRSLRVLIVNDEELIRSAVTRLLVDAHHDVTSVPSAPDGLRLIDDGMVFDVVLAELRMAPMTGMEFYEELLNRPGNVARRVVFLSDGPVDVKSAAFLESIPNIRLEKPFGFDKLMEALGRQCGL